MTSNPLNKWIKFPMISKMRAGVVIVVTALISFGDVSGKGVAAALYAALVGGLLRIVAQRRRGPAQALKMLNEMLLQRQVDARYVTMLVLLWSAHDQRMTIANAGGLPPVVCRNEEIISPPVEGVPLGLLPGREYDEVTLHAEPGDVIVLASDGITDQTNPAGKDFGRHRLAETVRRNCGGTAQAMVDAIYAEVEHFDESAPSFDDQTLVVIKVGERGAGPAPSRLD